MGKKAWILLTALAIALLSFSLLACTLASADPCEWRLTETTEDVSWDGDVCRSLYYRNGRGDAVGYYYWESNKSALHVLVFPAEGGCIDLNRTWTENFLDALLTSYHGVGWSGRCVVRVPSLPPGFKLPPRPPECN